MSNKWKINWANGDPGHPPVHNDIGLRMREQYDIRDYGASTASNDNSAAIQDALNDAAAAGSWCHIPQGIYKTLSPLSTPAGLFGIRGEGIINYRGAGGCALYLGDSEYGLGKQTRRIFLQDVTFSGIGSSNADGVIAKGWARGAIDRIKITNFANNGLYMRYCWIASLRDMLISDCSVGLRADGKGEDSIDQSFNAIWVSGGEIGSSCDYGVIIGDETLEANPSPTVGSGSGFFGSTFEGARKGGIWIVDGTNIAINNCYFERNGYINSPSYPLGYYRFHVMLGSGNLEVRNIHITQNLFSGNINSDLTDEAYGVLIENAYYVNIRENSFVHGISGRGVQGINSNAGDFVTMSNNYFNNAIDTRYDLPNLSSYILQDMRNGAGQHIQSGDVGHQVQASRDYIMRFLNSNEEEQARINLNGTIRLKDQSTGELVTISVNNGVLVIA